MTFFFILGIVVVFFLIIDLRGRVKMLERQMHNRPEPTISPQRASSAAASTVRRPAEPARGPGAMELFGRWLKEDWLLKLGALLLLIGFGWLATYAFMNNWIGPMGRIALGIIAGAFILLLGFWRIQKFIHQGGIFLVLGSTVILLTTFAARSLYGFFTPTAALAVMFLSTAFVGYASVRYKSRALALSGLILASIAPLLVASPDPNYVGLFAYLFIVMLGAVWITVITQRRELTAAALIVITLYSVPIFVGSYYFADRATLLLFAYAFAALFFITNTAGLLKLERKDMMPDLLTAAGNGLFLLVWIMTAAPEEWRSLIIAAWMVIFSMGAFAIFTATQKREPLYVYAGVGIAMLAAATAAELDGAVLTITYAVEAGMVSLIAYGLLHDMRIALRTSLLLIGPIILSISSLTSYTWNTGILHEDFFVLLVLGCVLMGLGVFYRLQRKEADDKAVDNGQVIGLLLIFGSLYFYALIWLSLHAEFLSDTAVMISLAIYTVIGLMTHLYGRSHDEKGLKVYGGVMLGFVVARLLLIDVWRMVLAGRIITFFLVGALLISTAFLGRKKHS